MLQLSVAASRIDEEQEFLTVGELGRIAVVAFAYDQKIIKAMISELAAFDMIRIIRTSGLPVSSENNMVMSLPKAQYLLKEMIGDIAYTNMCALRTALVNEYYNNRYVQCAYFGAEKHKAHAWVESKIVNAMAWYSTLVFQNRIEKTRIGERDMGALTRRERNVWDGAVRENMWDVVPHARRRVTVGIIRILTSRLENLIKRNLFPQEGRMPKY